MAGRAVQPGNSIPWEGGGAAMEGEERSGCSVERDDCEHAKR